MFDDSQMLFMYSFMKEEGIFVSCGIFRSDGYYKITLQKGLHSYQKSIQFFK